MWRSKAGALLLLVLTAGEARGEICAPPFFDDGSRLYGTAGTQVLWLEPLLRQHEVCWRRAAREDEKRIFVFGNSSVLGFPHPNDKSAIGLVNRAFAESDIPAHLFNLAMPWTYGPKDALIIRSAQAFRPDVIVYSVTLDDSYHQAPAGFAPVDAFFLANSGAVDRFAGERPPGIQEPFGRYRAYWADDWPLEPAWRKFRQLGSLVRIGVGQVGRRVRRAWFPDLPYETAPLEPASTGYDCAEVQRRFDLFWRGGRDWSLLPYLAQLRRDTGVEILVVNWPVAHDPVGDCYNARYSARDLEDYSLWLQREVASRGFQYLDLHDALPATEFIDTIHPALEGQRRVALRLEAALLDILAKPGAR